MDQQQLTLYYFGTNWDSAGHYFWDMSGDYMKSRSLDGFSIFPFNPERLANKPGTSEWSSNTGLAKGDARFFQIKGYSIWYIEGSAADDRPGTKSVWWVHRIINPEELKEIILGNKPSKRLIETMEAKKFKINWNYEQGTEN